MSRLDAAAPGQVIGRAGVGLAAGNNGWAANADVARIGLQGELRTEKLLNSFVLRAGGPTVLHDVQIPGSRANIDHIVVSGNVVTLVDTKVWKPGLYWTVAGMTFRGLSRFAHADKATMSMAADRLTKALRDRGITHPQIRCVVTVWPSSKSGDVNAWLLNIAGAKSMSGARFAGSLARQVGARPANMSVVRAIMQATGAGL